jgi:NTP pyrophosphatase (non-canonical NTP hydrolase)
MSKSGLTPYQDECLEILAEECAEVIQEKCNEYSWHNPALKHCEMLEQEMGDILAMIELVQQSGMGITKEGLEAAKTRKLEKVINWMIHSKD